MPGFKDATAQAKQFWASRNPRQRGYLLAGVGATVALLALFVRLIGTPDYKPLFTGLEPADAQTLSAQLDAEGIQHQTSADGKTISVPADKLDAARIQTASHGQPHSGRMGFELFDKMSWGQTEFDEKVTYQRALEGELERTIQTMNGVQSARVHLVMPTDSVFIDHQRSAKASVILKLDRGGLSKDAIQAIGRLVSGAVDELRPEDVSIIDADSDRSLGTGSDGQPDGEGSETGLTQRLVATLEPVVGLDKIRASVNIDYDHGATEQSEEKYDPAVSALLNVQRTEDQAGGGAGFGGVPGTASNIPSPKQAKPTTTTTQDSVQSSKSESAQYGVNKIVTHTVTPAGRIQRVSAAILVDDAVVRTVKSGKVSFAMHKRTPEELDKIQELAKAVIGFDAKRGDTISVQNMSFDSDVNDDLAPKWTDKAQKMVSDFAPVLRPVSLLAVFLLAYLFVLRPIQKKALGPGAPNQAPQPVLAAAPEVERLTAGIPEPSDDSRRATELKDQTVELIKQKPVNTARAVQAWLREEPS
ncbi:flagellar M-ring protein FliF [Silvibacterium bohemicum]|uniref:Flagellar M-ring protein n=1 Tax=Silvibacterium bohemicum TaxID=1577686 RepID=A0A841JZ60_9BACT|nr:flagellar basal-body MS-ring/collar protein FliF [Silvibacterium bohemicum]MBB6144999.1 flagellar M-ring protein FliF [Silvibacterium bohemicum]